MDLFEVPKIGCFPFLCFAGVFKYKNGGVKMKIDKKNSIEIHEFEEQFNQLTLLMESSTDINFSPILLMELKQWWKEMILVAKQE
jgi:hypothetical protein